MNEKSEKKRVAEIAEADFPAEVLEAKQPVLVAFRAPWSHPCQVLDFVLQDVAVLCGGQVRVLTANADDYPDLSLSYDIESIPTLLYFLNGTIRGKTVGTASKEAILAKMRTVFDLKEVAGPSTHPSRE